ncbi:hypothetical protein [Nostoc sp.]|uniref:hypothetical protein n=1 Tax=Nostoc sp. TaxID=1180 RepID=UPI003FA5B325
MMLTLHCLFTKLGQAILTNRCQIVIGCGSQVLQSDYENQSAWMRQSSNAVRDTANLQSRLRQQPRSHNREFLDMVTTAFS